MQVVEPVRPRLSPPRRALEGRSNAEIGRVIECDPSTVSYLVNHRNRLARVAPEAFVAVSEAP